jgi:hypothetical protein
MKGCPSSKFSATPPYSQIPWQATACNKCNADMCIPTLMKIQQANDCFKPDPRKNKTPACINMSDRRSEVPLIPTKRTIERKRIVRRRRPRRLIWLSRGESQKWKDEKINMLSARGNKRTTTMRIEGGYRWTRKVETKMLYCTKKAA